VVTVGTLEREVGATDLGAAMASRPGRATEVVEEALDVEVEHQS
jgi:hypothetical protein